MLCLLRPTALRQAAISIGLPLAVAALGTYSAFLDLALGLTGPVAGWVAGYYDLETIYLLAAAVVALAFILILRIYLQQRAALPRT